MVPLVVDLAGEGSELVTSLAAFKAVEAHDIVDVDLLFEAQLHFIAKKQVLSQADDVTRNAGVFGADLLGADHLHLLATEELQSFLVEGFDLAAQQPGLLDQTAAQHFVGALLNARFGWGCRCRFSHASD